MTFKDYIIESNKQLNEFERYLNSSRKQIALEVWREIAKTQMSMKYSKITDNQAN